MFKVKFEWLQYYPQGGQPTRKSKFRIFDATTAEELENQIQQEMASDDGGYQKNKAVTDITRL